MWYFRFWKIVLAIISFIFWRWEERSVQTQREKAQSFHRCWQAPRSCICAEQFHLGSLPIAHRPWEPCKLRLLHLPLLRYGEDVLGFSSASSLDGLWACHVLFSSVLLLAWSCLWTCLLAPNLDAACPGKWKSSLCQGRPQCPALLLPAQWSSPSPWHRSTPV